MKRQVNKILDEHYAFHSVLVVTFSCVGAVLFGVVVGAYVCLSIIICTVIPSLLLDMRMKPLLKGKKEK